MALFKRGISGLITTLSGARVAAEAPMGHHPISRHKPSIMQTTPHTWILSLCGQSCPPNCSQKCTRLPRQIIGAQVSKKDRKSTRLNSSHVSISYAVFCLKKKKKTIEKVNVIGRVDIAQRVRSRYVKIALS